MVSPAPPSAHDQQVPHAIREDLAMDRERLAEWLRAWGDNCKGRHYKEVSAAFHEAARSVLVIPAHAPLMAGGVETGELCEDCPPVGYPTDETRCLPCPRRAATASPAEPIGKWTDDPERLLALSDGQLVEGKVYDKQRHMFEALGARVLRTYRLERLGVPQDEHLHEGWKDIETAPKDGTEFVAFRADQGVFAARWHFPPHEDGDGSWDFEQAPTLFDSSGNDLTGAEPTHWRPLPAPPAIRDARPGVGTPSDRADASTSATSPQPGEGGAAAQATTFSKSDSDGGSLTIDLPSVWIPKSRLNRMGGWCADIYLSHWNRNRPGFLVGFNVTPGGTPNRKSRVSIHPHVLAERYHPAENGADARKGSGANTSEGNPATDEPLSDPPETLGGEC